MTGTSYGVAAATAAVRISASRPALPRQRSAAALAGHLGHRAAEVEVDVGHAVLGAEDLGRLADVDRVGAVELHRPHGLELVEDQHRPGDRVALDQAAAGDHLADVEPGPLLGAQPAVRRVGDAGHRGQHHGRLDAQRTQGQRRRGQDGHAAHCRGSSVGAEIRRTVSSGAVSRQFVALVLLRCSCFVRLGRLLGGLGGGDLAGPHDRGRTPRSGGSWPRSPRPGRGRGRPGRPWSSRRCRTSSGRRRRRTA